MPYEVDSENPIIQKVKLQFRKRERKKDKKRALTKGFKLEHVIRFGKHNGSTIKDIIHNHRSYWEWIIKENVILLHPDTLKYWEGIK